MYIQDMTSAEADILFNPYYPTFVEVNSWAHKEFLGKHSHPYLKPSCKAHYFQNLVFGELSSRLCSMGVAELTDDQNHQLLIFQGSAYLSIKKLDENFMPNYATTARSIRYYRQSHLPTLEGLPKIVCGAKISSDWTRIDGVFLTQPRNSYANNWVLNITEAAVAHAMDENQDKFSFASETEYFQPHKTETDDERKQAEGDKT